MPFTSNETFRQIFQSSVEAIIMVDKDGRILLANPVSEHMFGYEAGAFTGARAQGAQGLMVPRVDSLEHGFELDADGRLLAVRARIVGDTGAYASVGAKVLERAAGHACGAYRVDNVDVEARAIYTNNPPCGAMRGFGVTIGPAEALRALTVIVVGVPALYAIGALFAAVVLRFGEVHALVQGVRGLFTAVCGMSFPIVVLPDWAQTLALSLPPTYLIADLRAVLLTGSELGRIVGDLAVLAGMGVVLAIAAAFAFRRTELHARRGGRLAQY